MTDSEIMETISTAPATLTFFSSTDCSVCQTLGPKVEKISSDIKNVKFLKINSQSHPIVAGQNMVFSVPTIIIFSRGSEVKRWSRNLTVDEIAVELKRLENINNPCD